MTTATKEKPTKKAKQQQEVGLILCDTFRYLTTEKESLTFNSGEERDKYIFDVRDKLEKAQKFLQKGKETGSTLVGINAFSASTLGDELFGKGNDKRVVVWNKDLEPLADKDYTDNRAFFQWGVSGKGWVFNLPEDEKLFTGEFLQSEEANNTALLFTRNLIRRFSNEGSTILEVNVHEGSVIKEAAILEGRKYKSFKEAK